MTSDQMMPSPNPTERHVVNYDENGYFRGFRPELYDEFPDTSWNNLWLRD